MKLVAIKISQKTTAQQKIEAAENYTVMSQTSSSMKARNDATGAIVTVRKSNGEDWSGALRLSFKAAEQFKAWADSVLAYEQRAT